MTIPTPTGERKCCDNCKWRAGRGADFVGCLNTSCPCHPIPAREEWEEEFDERFGDAFHENHMEFGKYAVLPNFEEDAKRFIQENRATLLSQLEAEVEERRQAFIEHADDLEKTGRTFAGLDHNAIRAEVDQLDWFLSIIRSYKGK